MVKYWKVSVLSMLILVLELVHSQQKTSIALVLYSEDMMSINRTALNKRIIAATNISNNAKLQVDFYELKRVKSSYQYILDATIQEMLSKNKFIVSFLRGKEAAILHEILRYKHIKHLSLSTDDCHLSEGEHRDAHEHCRMYTAEHLDAILILQPHFAKTRVAIISSKAECSLSFANNLFSEFEKQNTETPERQTNLSLFSFSEDPPDVFHISSLLYDVKFFQPTVIVLVCVGSMQSLVLQAAAKHEMLGYGDIWIIPEFAKTSRNSPIPMQLITIERTIGSETVSMVTENQISVATALAYQLTQADHESRKQIIHGKYHHSSLPCTSNHFSKVKISLKTSNRSDWVTIYRKAGSSNFQFQSYSGFALSIFAGKQPSVILRVVTIIDAPFTMEAAYLKKSDENSWTCENSLPCRIPIAVKNGTVNEPGWKQTCCIGHSIDLLQLLMKKLNFGVDVYIVRDGFYGSVVNGSFNGMIGDVSRHEADFAIAGLTITALRSAVVDFTSPFIRQDIGIVTLTTKTKLRFVNWQFAVPVDTSVIIAVFVGILLGTFLTYVLENQEVVMKRLLDPKEFPPRYSWREGFTYFSGLTFQRDLGGKNPTEFGSRVVAVGFAFAMLVVMTTYTAVLTATKVTQKEINPFKGIKDERMINPTPDFKFATVPSTSIEGFFKDAPDENFRRMYLFMQKYNVRSVAEGLKKVKSGELQAFIHEYPFLLYFLSKQSKCELKITGEPLGQSGFALALQKGSTWKDRLSYEILNLKESRVLDDLNKKWLAQTCLEQSSALIAPDGLSLEYFGGLVLTVAIAFVALLLMLPLEFAYRKYHRIPINAVVDRVLGWHESRKQRESCRSMPTLKSISSETDFNKLT